MMQPVYITFSQALANCIVGKLMKELEEEKYVEWNTFPFNEATRLEKKLQRKILSIINSAAEVILHMPIRIDLYRPDQTGLFDKLAKTFSLPSHRSMCIKSLYLECNQKHYARTNIVRYHGRIMHGCTKASEWNIQQKR